MPRALRKAPGGYVYHALNRANAGLPIFDKDGDYLAFERILLESLDRVEGMQLLAFCVMPNHWHLVLRPAKDGELSDFLHWLTLTHAQRWKTHYHQIGRGHLYQGRFKSLPVEEDEHFLAVCRYVERNALRAGLVTGAQDWRWGSLHHRESGGTSLAARLAEWPVPRPEDWRGWVNSPQTDAELAALRECLNRGRPFGSPGWVESTVRNMGLESTMRKRGRPKTSKRVRKAT